MTIDRSMRRPGPVHARRDVREPRSTSLPVLGPPIERKGLERVKTEAQLVRRQHFQLLCAARVRDPRADRDRRGRLLDPAVGNAEDDEIGVAAVEIATRGTGRDPLAEARGHRFADASSADDAC